MIADLDTLLIALYVELTDRIIPSRNVRRGPGRPPVVTDAELVCLAVAQVVLRYDDERHWLTAAERIEPVVDGTPASRTMTRSTSPAAIPGRRLIVSTVGTTPRKA